MSYGVIEVPNPLTTKVLEKFFSKVSQADNCNDCWEWCGYFSMLQRIT